MDVRYRIRPAVLADSALLAGIERRCFSDPWSEASFREALGTDWTFGLVAQNQRGELAGYLIGREAAGTGEVLNLAVSPEHRRAGVAKALLDAGLRTLRARGVEEVYLEVRQSNVAARALYVSFGFRPIGQRRAYYRNPREDAVVLRLDLEEQRA